MHTEPQQGWLYRLGQSERDILLALGLSIPRLCDVLERAARGEEKPTNADAAAAQLQKLLHELSFLDERTLQRIAYGFPGWFRDRFKRALDTVLNRVTLSEHVPSWASTAAYIECGGRFEQLCEVAELIAYVDAPVPKDVFEGGAELAAAGATSLADVMRRAEWLRGENDPVARELSTRLVRLDLVFLSENRGAVVLGATLERLDHRTEIEISIPGQAEVAERLEVSGWKPADRSFHDGVKAGRDAAFDLLKHVGHIGYSGLRLELHSILPIEHANDGSAGLAVALAILGRAANLPLTHVVATGVIDSQAPYALQPVSPEDAARKLEGVKADGFCTGLLCHVSDAAVPDGITRVTQPTLAAAAEAAWGERWNRWVSARQTERLRTLGVEFAWAERWAGALRIDGEPVVVSRDETVDKLVQRFEGAVEWSSASFVMAPALSGKTWIAQLAADKLERLAWRIVPLVKSPHVSLGPDEMVRAIEAAVGPVRQPRTLVVIDDVDWRDGLQDLPSRLSGLSERLKISILAISRVGDDTGWRNEDSIAIPGKEALPQFVERLFLHSAFRGRLANPHSVIGSLVEQSGGDIWWLMRLAATTGKESFTGDVRRELLSRLDELSEPQHRALKLVAAMTYAGLATPAWALADASAISDFSGMQLPSGEWKLLSRAAATHILGASREEIRGFATKEIAGFVSEAVHGGYYSIIPAILERLHYSEPDLLASVYDIARGDLNRWSTERERNAWLVARGLYALRETLSLQDRRTWAARILALFADPHLMRASEVAECLHMLRAHQFLLGEDAASSERWAQTLDRLPEDMSRLLARETDSVGKSELIRALYLLHEPQSYQAIKDNLLRFIPESSVPSLADYQLALRATETATQIGATDPAFWNAPELVRLATTTPASETVDVLVSRLILGRQLGLLPDWEKDVAQFTRALPQLIGSSLPNQLRRALRTLARFDRSLAVNVLNRSRDNTAAALATRLSRLTSATDMADLIATIANIHAVTARKFLYLEESAGGDQVLRPKPALLKAAVKAIITRGDAKGAGLLMRAAQSVDDHFTSTSEGFGRKLAEELKLDFFATTCRTDPRTSVIFHLVEGLLAVDAPFTAQVLDETVDAIARGVNTSLSPWAPRLAIMLLEDPELGPIAIARLRAVISEARLSKCMWQASRLEALTYFHQLGRCLYPDVVKVFADTFARDSSRIIGLLNAADRPEILLRAIKVISATLRQAGVADGIFDRVRVDWSHQLLRQARTSGDLAECLRLLHSIIPAFAAQLVAKVSSGLQLHVGEALKRAPHIGAELVDAIENALPGAGRSILSELQKDQRTWDTVTRELAHVQNPREQGTTFNMLAEHGGRVGDNERTRIRQRWQREVGAVSSPSCLVPLLRMFASWDVADAAGHAADVNLARIGRRLRFGSREDLQWLEALVASLETLGRDDAITLLESVSWNERVCRALGLQQSAHLLCAMRRWSPAQAEAFGALVSNAAVHRARVQFVVHDTASIIDLGWTAREVSRDALLDLGPETPWLFSLPQPPWVRLWAAAWLRPRPWTSALIDRSLDDLTQEPQKPFECAMLLTTLARLGRLNDFSRREVLETSAASSLYWLDAMWSETELRPRLSELAVQRPDLFLRHRAPASILHPARQRVADLLGH